MPSDDTLQNDESIDRQILHELGNITALLASISQQLANPITPPRRRPLRQQQPEPIDMPDINRAIPDDVLALRPGDLLIWYLQQPEHRGAAYPISAIADALCAREDVTFERTQIAGIPVGMHAWKRADELVADKTKRPTTYRAADIMPPCIDPNDLPRREDSLPGYCHILANFLDRRLRESGWRHFPHSQMQPLTDFIILREPEHDWMDFIDHLANKLASVVGWRLNVTCEDRFIHLLPEQTLPTAAHHIATE